MVRLDGLQQSLLVPNLLYGCEIWTVTERRIQAFESKSLRLLRISYRESKITDLARNTVATLVVYQEPSYVQVKCRKLICFGHETRPDTLSKTAIQSTSVDVTVARHEGVDWSPYAGPARCWRRQGWWQALPSTVPIHVLHATTSTIQGTNGWLTARSSPRRSVELSPFFPPSWTGGIAVGHIISHHVTSHLNWYFLKYVSVKSLFCLLE